MLICIEGKNPSVEEKLESQGKITRLLLVYRMSLCQLYRFIFDTLICGYIQLYRYILFFVNTYMQNAFDKMPQNIKEEGNLYLSYIISMHYSKINCILSSTSQRYMLKKSGVPMCLVSFIKVNTHTRHQSKLKSSQFPPSSH